MPKLLEKLKDAKGCVWAVGTSQKAVAKEDYIHITKTLTLEAAQAFQRFGMDADKLNFVFVSGEGATREPGICTPLFGRIKGETESALVDLEARNPHFRPILVRPSFVDSKDHKEIQQWAPPATGLKRITESVARPLIRNSFPTLHSPTNALGEFLAGLATGSLDDRLKGNGVEISGGTAVVTNVGFRRLMEL